MGKKFVARQSAVIKASAGKVWDALINPEMIRKYMFGTEAVSDWKEGSPIRYRGEWEGKRYEDKGTVLRIQPGKLLETSYWSGFSGLPDVPENYSKVAYKLAPDEGGVRLTITQDNNVTMGGKRQAEKNWEMVLDSLKKLLEKE